MNVLSRFNKMHDNIKSHMKSREFNIKDAVADWLSRQEWEKNDHIYFFIAGLVFWSIYVLMIMYNFYQVYNFNDYWIVPCGLGLVAFLFTAWSYEKA